MSSPLRILITGATGFLGRTLLDLAPRDVLFIPTARHPPEERGWLPLDVTRPGDIRTALREARPDWVIHTAAMTGVDACEAAPADARRIHVEATRRMGEACADWGCGLVHLSTNYVFDGRSGPYSETDPTGPLNVYGQTKLEGEGFVLDGALRGFVARTAVLYGCRAASGSNFVTWAAGALSRGERLRIVKDEWSNPTPVSELARALLAACRAGATGLYHVAGGEFLSRLQMVDSLCEVMGLDRSLVTPVRSADLGQKARRPLGTGLRIDRAQATGLLVTRPFVDHLQELAPKLRHVLGSP